MPNGDLYNKLAELSILQNELNKIKKREMELRCEVADLYSETNTGKTETYYQDDLKVSIKKSVNVSLDKKLFSSSKGDMNAAELSCIDMVPTLNVSRYNKIVEEGISDVLDCCITVKPAAPTVKISLKE